jgi:hypothetical protein
MSENGAVLESEPIGKVPNNLPLLKKLADVNFTQSSCDSTEIFAKAVLELV